MGYRLVILPFQILLAMYDIDAQTGEWSQGRRRWIWRQLPATLPPPPAALLLGRRRRDCTAIYGGGGTLGGGPRKTRLGDFRRERDELVHEVLWAKVSIELLERAALGPRALDEERGEGMRYEGRGGAPYVDGLWARGEAVGRDVAEEEELSP